MADKPEQNTPAEKPEAGKVLAPENVASDPKDVKTPAEKPVVSVKPAVLKEQKAGTANKKRNNKPTPATETKTVRANQTEETRKTEANAQRLEKALKEDKIPEGAIPSIGGYVVPVEIDNSKNKLESESEKRYHAGVASAKAQRKAAREAEAKSSKKESK